MSLILEALRKSEAERRRGSTPDVAMELPPVPAARARATPAWVLPVAVITLVALLAGWWWSQRETDHVDSPAPIATTPVVEPGIETPAPAVVVARQPLPPLPPTTFPEAPAVSDDPPVTYEMAPPLDLQPPPQESSPPQRDVAAIDTTSIPPVKLSMHMWDESPSRRFVILDGQRMTEGDRNGELSVVAIERDGVVVERNGQRARVPLP